jgi:hypothetical protein
LVAEGGKLEAGGGDGLASNGVVEAGRAACGVGVHVFFASDEPPGFFEAGEHGVQRAAGDAGKSHKFEAVAGLAGVFEEDLKDPRHLGGDVEVSHAAQCMSST